MSSINGKTLIKVSEDNLDVNPQFWKNKTLQKSATTAKLTPQIFNKNRDFHSRQSGADTNNFIKRIEK